METSNILTPEEFQSNLSLAHSYMTRQPIYNSSGQVDAYELLYRTADRNYASIGNETTAQVILSESIFNFELTNGKKAFIHLGDTQLLNQVTRILNPEQFIIEIAENIIFTPEAIHSLCTLKSANFQIALNDYMGTDISDEILSLIDIIKIDFKSTTKEQRATFAPTLIHQSKTLLAKHIETKEDVLEAMSLGCQFFQGSYYFKPVIQQKRIDISTASYLKLCKELASPHMDFDAIARIINEDSYLTGQLLKRMKTFQYYRGNTINSIKHALVMMGNEEVRRWLMLILIRGMVNVRSDELIRTALIRAFMCEKVARHSGQHHQAAKAFNTGLFSILTTNAELKSTILSDLQLPQDIFDALAGTDNILKRFLDIVLCYEYGQWTKLEYLANYTVSGLNQHILPRLYFLSVSEADEMLNQENNLSA